jgi:hypothetical protein
MLKSRSVFAHRLILHGFDRKMGQQMLALMLDSRFKNMHLITSYVVCKNVVRSIVDYDSQLLLSLLVKFYKSSLMLNAI